LVDDIGGSYPSWHHQYGDFYDPVGSPLRLGLDFVGGTRLQLERDCTKPGNCDKPIDITAVRQVMDAEGLGNSSIQILGEKQQALTIRTKNLNVEQVPNYWILSAENWGV
jgi:preprotein translocase subunit SecF